MSVVKNVISTWEEVMRSDPALLSSPHPAEGDASIPSAMNNPSVPVVEETFIQRLARLPADELDEAVRIFLEEWSVSLDIPWKGISSAPAGVMEEISAERNHPSGAGRDSPEPRSPHLTPYVLERPSSSQQHRIQLRKAKRRSKRRMPTRKGTIRINGEDYLVMDHWINDDFKENIKFEQEWTFYDFICITFFVTFYILFFLFFSVCILHS